METFQERVNSNVTATLVQTLPTTLLQVMTQVQGCNQRQAHLVVQVTGRNDPTLEVSCTCCISACWMLLSNQIFDLGWR